MTSQVKSSEVLVLLSKVSPSRWTTLLDTKRGNVKLDFSRACDSEDETDSEGEEIPTREPLPTGDDVSALDEFLKHSVIFYVLIQTMYIIQA